MPWHWFLRCLVRIEQFDAQALLRIMDGTLYGSAAQWGRNATADAYRHGVERVAKGLG